MKILVTGSKGQLGSEIKFLSPHHNHDFVFIDFDDLDLTKTETIIPYLTTINPDFIVNCAAYTAVDKAEDESDIAAQINEHAPSEIAKYCKESGCRLIHISTDYVFDGNFDRPITEDDKPNPKSVYGQTKLAGENAVLDTLASAYVIRTSWVYSEFGNNFVKTMVRLGKEKDEINVVSDQFGTPTWARDLAGFILSLIPEINKGNDQPGIYHFSNEGEISWYNFAQRIIELSSINCKVNPIGTNQFPTKAKRPSYSVLDKSKLKTNFDFDVPNWQDSLRHYIDNV
ncbi:MAG: dTDP-4-dehydrorhamnose reductase [Fulvivirga sp.]